MKAGSAWTALRWREREGRIYSSSEDFRETTATFSSSYFSQTLWQANYREVGPFLSPLLFILVSRLPVTCNSFENCTITVVVSSTKLVLHHISGFATDLFGVDQRYPSYLKLNRSQTPPALFLPWLCVCHSGVMNTLTIKKSHIVLVGIVSGQTVSKNEVIYLREQGHK